jgi:hypothetical protein
MYRNFHCAIVLFLPLSRANLSILTSTGDIGRRLEIAWVWVRSEHFRFFDLWLVAAWGLPPRRGLRPDTALHPRYLISTATSEAGPSLARVVAPMVPRYPGLGRGRVGEGRAQRKGGAAIPTTDGRLICRKVTGASLSRYPWRCHGSVPRLPPASGSARGSSSGWL